MTKIGFQVLIGLLVLWPGAGLAQDIDKVVTKHGRFDENLLVAGREISVDGEVNGDVISFGRDIDVAGIVVGDVMAAGRSITVTADVDGDVRIAGETLNVTAPVTGEVMAAGRDVVLRDTARVDGRAMLAGERVRVGGAVGGNVKAAGRTVTVLGAIAGDAELMGEEIIIAATARIDGDLVYRSQTEADIAPGAEILGDTVFIRSDGPKDLVDRFLAGASVLGLTMFAGLFLLGSLQTLVAPGLFTTACDRLRRPWRSLGIGFAVLVLAPVAMVLTAITVIGIPITVVVLALFVVALLLGLLLSAGALGRFGAQLIGRNGDSSFLARELALAVGLLALFIVGFIPVLGGLVFIAALVFGLGVLSHAVWGTRGQRA